MVFFAPSDTEDDGSEPEETAEEIPGPIGNKPFETVIELTRQTLSKIDELLLSRM